MILRIRAASPRIRCGGASRWQAEKVRGDNMTVVLEHYLRYCCGLLRVTDNPRLILLRLGSVVSLSVLLRGRIRARLSGRILLGLFLCLLSFRRFTICDVENANIPKFDSTTLAKEFQRNATRGGDILAEVSATNNSEVGSHRTLEESLTALGAGAQLSRRTRFLGC
jgi:hypothetical protein